MDKTVPSFSSGEFETLMERRRLVEALSELRNLLEEYSPSWYTEEHHHRVQTALHPRKKR